MMKKHSENNQLQKKQIVPSGQIHCVLFATQYSTLSGQYLAYLYLCIPSLVSSCFQNSIVSVLLPLVLLNAGC